MTSSVGFKSRTRRQFVLSSILAFVALVVQGQQESGYLGIGFSIDRDSGTLTVEQVLPDSPAAETGIRVGDQVSRIGETEARFPSHRAALDFLVGRATIGVPLLLTLSRDGLLLEEELVPTRRPPGLGDRNERALRCADGESDPEGASARAFGSVP